MDMKNIVMKTAFVLTLVLSLVVLTSCKKKFTVTFNSNGGTAIEAVEVKKGEKVTKPSDPTREGFDFEGWTLNGELYDFNQEVKEDITLIAKWKEKTPQPVVSSGDIPENVQMSDTTVSWNPVDKATGYVVYVNGVEKVVEGTSISLSEISTLLNHVEDVICVTAKFGETESALSLPVVKRGTLSDSEVSTLMQQFGDLNISKEQAKEILYAMKKNNVSVNDLMELAQSINPSTPETLMQGLFTLLNNTKLVGIVETLFTIGYGQIETYLQQLEAIPTAVLTESDKTTLNALYSSIKQTTGYVGENDAMDDKLYTEVVLPWISAVVASKNIAGDTVAIAQLMVLGTCIYGWYLSQSDVEASRNGQVITIKIKGETITTNFADISKMFMAVVQESTSTTTYTEVLQKYYNVKIFPVAIQVLQELKPTFEENYNKVKAMISVYLPVFVDGVKNILSMQDMVNGLVEAAQNIIAQLQNVQNEEEFNAIIKSANAFKNQALDAMIEVLPTQKQWNAITAVMEYYLGSTEEGKALVESLGYEKVTEFANVLSTLKTLDLTKYDMMAIVNALMSQDEESIQEAKAVVMQILSDLETLLPKTEQPTQTLEEICEKIMKNLQKVEDESFPILSVLNILFGETITKNTIVQVISFANTFVEYVVNYNFDQAEIQAILETIMANGYLDKESGYQLLQIGYEVLAGFVDTEKINQLKGVVVKVLELIQPEMVELVNAGVEIVNNNLDLMKEYLELSLKSLSAQGDITKLEAMLDTYIAFVSDSEKYTSFREVMSEWLFLVGAITIEEEIDVLFPLDFAETLQKAKALIGIPFHQLTEDQLALIDEINYTGFVLYWAYPSDLLVYDFIQFSVEGSELVVQFDASKLSSKWRCYSFKCVRIGKNVLDPNYHSSMGHQGIFDDIAIVRFPLDRWLANFGYNFVDLGYNYYLNISLTYSYSESHSEYYSISIDITDYVLAAISNTDYSTYSVDYAY